MGVKASDLKDLIGKPVILQIDTSEDDDTIDDFIEVVGKLETLNEYGVVLKIREVGPIMYPMAKIIDVEVEEKRPGRITKRWLSNTERPHVRQHLADRHGVPMTILNILDSRAAEEYHGNIKHDDLGHGHGEKPPARRGRPPGS